MPPAPGDPRRRPPPALPVPQAHQPLGAQPDVQSLEAGPVAAGPWGQDLAAGQIIQAGELGGSRPVTTISRTSVRIGGEKSTICWRSGVIVRFAVAMSPLPKSQARQQLVAHHRHEHHPDRARAGLETAVEAALELEGILGRDALWLAMIQIVVGTAGHHEQPDQPALDHPSRSPVQGGLAAMPSSAAPRSTPAPRAVSWPAAGAAPAAGVWFGAGLSLGQKPDHGSRLGAQGQHPARAAPAP